MNEYYHYLVCPVCNRLVCLGTGNEFLIESDILQDDLKKFLAEHRYDSFVQAKMKVSEFSNPYDRDAIRRIIRVLHAQA